VTDQGYVHPTEQRNQGYKRRKVNHDAGADAVIDASNSAELMDSGSLGAFVHGLEDEFSEVRSATIDAVCLLSCRHKVLTRLAVELLVDMFNDEIDEVRIKAITSVSRILDGNVVPLSEDQLNVVLCGLEDQNQPVRYALHRLIAAMSISSTVGLHSCLESLLNSLRRYPTDSPSVYQCVAQLGQHHACMVELLTRDLLGLNTIFLPPEPTMDSVPYIVKLILIFHAAAQNKSILALLPAYLHRHYSFLSHQNSKYFPKFKLSFVGQLPALEAVPATPGGGTQDQEVLELLRSSLLSVDGVRVLWRQGRFRKVRALVQACRAELKQLGQSHLELSERCCFHDLYLQCLDIVTKVLEGRASQHWILDQALSDKLPTRLLSLVHRTQVLFGGLDAKTALALSQLRTTACALLLCSRWQRDGSYSRGQRPSQPRLIRAMGKVVDRTCQLYAEQDREIPPILSKLRGACSSEEQEETLEKLEKSAKPDELDKADKADKAGKPRGCPVSIDDILSSTVNELSMSQHLQLDGAVRKISVDLSIAASSQDKPVACLSELPHQLNVGGMVLNVSSVDSLAIRVGAPDQTSQLFPLNNSLDLLPIDPTSYQLKTELRVHHGAWNGAGVLEVSVVKLTGPEDVNFFETIGASTEVLLSNIEPYHVTFRSLK